jgi:uncharacterized protein YjbI with pentapeptide repeats
MANPEHLNELYEGVETWKVTSWNQWRVDSAVIPDLSEAMLIGAKLRGADLHDANLIHNLPGSPNATNAAQKDGFSPRLTKVSCASLRASDFVIPSLRFR